MYKGVVTCRFEPGSIVHDSNSLIVGQQTMFAMEIVENLFKVWFYFQ